MNSMANRVMRPPARLMQLPDENALLESSGIALLFNLILSVHTFDFMIP